MPGWSVRAVPTEAKLLVAGHRRIAIPLARWRRHGVVVDREKVILIEGFPRSANSFAVAAFDFAQGGHPRIAHHLHAAAHVLESIRLGVPAIVLIRDPYDAVPELVIAHPSFTLRQGFRSYLAFYRRLIPHRHGFVVGAFPEVTSAFGAVIRRVNRRFGSSFTEFVHDDRNQQAVFDAMDAYWRGRVGPGEELERRVGRPSDQRDRMTRRLRSGVEWAALADLRAQSRALHEQFISEPSRCDAGAASVRSHRSRSLTADQRQQ
jgi:hypothetical protein